MLFSKANCGTFSTSVIIQACGAATGILTARLLGPASRGELATVILWPTILSNLGLMGCNWAVAREVAKKPKNEGDWIAAGTAVGLATACIFFAAGYFLLPWLLPADRRYLLPVTRLFLLLLPLDILNQVLLAVEHGRMRWRRYNLLRLSFFVFYFIMISLIGITKRVQIRWFVVAFLASQLLSLLVRVWVHRKSFVVGKSFLHECSHLMRQGMPFFGATISNLISLQLDTILVVALFNAEAAGIYAVACAFANGQSSLGEALGITSFAVLSNEKDSKNREKIITETFRQSTLISCAVGIALSCLIPILVGPLFGFAYAKSVRPAMLLALSAAVMGSANILNQGLRGAGRPQAGLLSQLIGAGVMALSVVFFLRGFELMGMAFAVGISACVQLLVLIIAAAEWLEISPFQFWPFGAGNFRLFFQQVADLRFRYLRIPASISAD
ncbi:MAG TPA: oligosaccharide flippase family protein [Candidatus Saccharimonadales bacterium]|jgi:O-antigen/teichoic acid export membrane protein|nr:oligosaccharide flippase family protein [Candidatus Saccharimonadales bacterium]